MLGRITCIQAVCWLSVVTVLGMVFTARAETPLPAPNGLIVLHTDYGADSIYVGALKGAIYSKFPGARIDAISNSIPSYDIEAGAALLAEVNREFPKGTTFCCIVDPGVGTARRGIAMRTEYGQFFVAPDNGLLQRVAEKDGIAELRECSNHALWRAGAQSTTFHGRDIFGPVAAAIASGTSLDNVGPEVSEITQVDVQQVRNEGGRLHGEVMRIDDYGNVVTNIDRQAVEQLGVVVGDVLLAEIGQETVTAPLRGTYSDVAPGEQVAVFQSSGYLEFAINKGHLARTIGAVFHAPVVVSKQAGEGPESKKETRTEPKPDAAKKELEMAIRFEQSGGFAGIVESLTIQPDGSAHFESRTSAVDLKLHPATVAKLGDAVRELDFEALARPPKGPVLGGADYINFVIAVGEHRIETNSLRAPDELNPLLRLLSGIAQDARKNATPK